MSTRLQSESPSMIRSTSQSSRTSIMGGDTPSLRRQADPLPVKVGELGFNPTLHTSTTAGTSTSTVSLPLGPHPAERRLSRAPSPVTVPLPEQGSHTRSDSASTASTTRPSNNVQPFHSTISLVPSAKKIKEITRKLTPSELPSRYLFGTSPRTLSRFFAQLFLLTGTAVAWVFAASRAVKTIGEGSSIGGGIIFVHVAFTVCVLAQLLMLERALYRLRAERYKSLHPSLPLALQQQNRNRSNIPFAPWNRQPLPTYAAAMGFRGTGDVEDNEIARLVAIGHGDVPPQYGNHRGSTLLAYGMGVRTSNSRPISQQMTIDDHTQVGSGSRPVSYGRSQEIEDAYRASRLFDALTRLEGH